jgi:diaminohydroxyphosphoribosylaminopyrimidine deaminase/5-amino-6-(5-phosphoribosylamino)uracil reductase
MQRALDAAAAVRGSTSPNPWVGAIVVREGADLGAGATSPPGGPHAEANALAAAGDARGAELYVTLEPCAAFPGKRTPPCADAIVAAGLRRVVVALEDPDPNVGGRGIATLRAAGIEVEVGDGAEAARELLRPYIAHRRSGRPYVIAKFATSLDGRTAATTGDSKWITGEAARDRGHQQRAWVDAIMVGSGTVLADDPELTARPGGVLAERQPLRIVLDARGRVPPSARLFTAPGRTLVATSATAPAVWKRAIAGTGATILEGDADERGVNLDQLLAVLGQRGILSLWAEGGATLLGSLFDSGAVNEVWAFLAPRIMGGPGPGAVAGEGVAFVRDAHRLSGVQVEVLGEDVLVRGYLNGNEP